MFYVVPNVRLVTQDKEWSCWYASAQMLIQWRRNSTKSTEVAHPDPSQVSRWKSRYGLANTDAGSISNGDILAFAKNLGLKHVPPLSPTPELILSWLKKYGPLWVNGKSHITVISGIRSQNNKIEVLVFDPAQENRSQITGEWRDLEKWYVGNSHSSRDIHTSVDATFLYVP